LNKISDLVNPEKYLFYLPKVQVITQKNHIRLF
jgi:hypothetical protein